MADQRKTLKVQGWIRANLNDFADKKGLKNVSDAIAYLYIAYDMLIDDKLRVVDDKLIRKAIVELNNQLSLDLEV